MTSLASSVAWTYAALKGALATLSPAPAQGDFAGAATALNAQTKTAAGQAFTVHAAKLVAQTSGNMSWARILQRAEATAAIPPATAADGAILAARTIASMDDAQMVDPSSAGYSAWQAGLSALQAVGDLTAADVAAINALASVTAPAWNPPVTAGDVQTAEAQP